MRQKKHGDREEWQVKSPSYLQFFTFAHTDRLHDGWAKFKQLSKKKQKKQQQPNMLL